MSVSVKSSQRGDSPWRDRSKRWVSSWRRSSAGQPRHRVVLTHPLGLKGQLLDHRMLTQRQRTVHLLEDLQQQLIAADMGLLKRAGVPHRGFFNVAVVPHDLDEEVQVQVDVAIRTRNDRHAMELLTRLLTSLELDSSRVPTHMHIETVTDEHQPSA